MRDVLFPPLRIGWEVTGGEKWGWEVVIFDPLEKNSDRILIAPEKLVPFSYESEQQAKQMAVQALRELADRIERGEQ